MRAITIILAQGPSLGFHVNLKKRELCGVSDLSSFPLSIQTSNQSNIEILGASIGDAEFCKQNLSLVTINDLGSMDPQVALVLLCICSSFCNLAHIARATPPHLILGSMKKFDADVHCSFAVFTGGGRPS